MEVGDMFWINKKNKKKLIIIQLAIKFAFIFQSLKND